MMQRHRVWCVGENIDTDALAPGAYMKMELADMAAHCLESHYPGLAAALRPGDVIVAGPGFGIGSSREQAVGVLVQLGVKAVIAPSFSGLYFRNAFNLGLLAIVCEQAEQISEGSLIEIDTEQAVLRLYDAGAPAGAEPVRVLPCQPIPPFLVEMASGGGLLAQLQRQFQPS